MRKNALIKKIATKLKISQAKAEEAIKIIMGAGFITNKQQVKIVTVEKKVPVQVIKEVVKIVKVETASATPKRKPAAKKVVRKAAPKKRVTAKKTTAKKVVKKAAPKKRVAAKKTTAKKVVKKATPKKRVAAKKTTAKKVVRKAAPKKRVTAKKVVRKAAPKKRVVAKKTTAKKVVRKAAPKKRVVTKKVAAPRKVDPKFAKFKINNFQIIEGIGPKIEELLHRAKIKNWNELASTSSSSLKKILATAAGSRYQMHDPSTWGKQAKMAQSGKWKELVKFQKVLDAGKNNNKNRRTPSKVERMAGIAK